MARIGYFQEIFRTLKTAYTGLGLTWKHFRKARLRNPVSIQHPGYFSQTGSATIAYPMQKPFVPETGRYRLHMETDDCIVCDKCARICPVDCIEIESIKSSEDLGITSDGSRKRLHLARFDIDMAKCCYCGLCTTVCPTECLTMTRVYDYPETDRNRFIYHFGGLSPTDAVRIRKAEEEKAALKKAQAPAAEETGTPIVKKRIPGKLPVRKPPESPDSDVPPEALPEPEEKKIPPGMKKLPARKPISPDGAENTELPQDEPRQRILPKLKKPIIRRPEDPPQQ